MGDWTAEAEPAVALCEDWARPINTSVRARLYLFGSVIYKGGEQFDRTLSDIDIVAVLPPDLDTVGRVETIEKLRQHKLQLELNIIPALGRCNAGEPGVSLVPITDLELRTNVHKSGARRFFDKNFFLDLSTGTERLGLPDAGVATLPDENRAALEYVQKVRNGYLGQAANFGGGLTAFTGADPMPKAVTRFAAQLDPSAGVGEWYDTRRGLEMLFEQLRARRTEDGFRQLFDKVSVRRGGRGINKPLSSLDQLHLAELLYDIASKVPTEKVLQWEIVVKGSASIDTDIDRLILAMRAVAPDAILISFRPGSVILRYQSPMSRFDLLEVLHKRGLLVVLLDAVAVDLRVVDDNRLSVIPKTEFPGSDRVQQLRDVISQWTPQFEREFDGERQLADWLQQAVDRNLLPGARIVSEPAIRLTRGIVRPDVAVFWENGPRKEMVGVELIMLRKLGRFFDVLERMLEMPFQVILVIVGDANDLAKIRDDADRLLRVGGNVLVVMIARNMKNQE